MVYIVNEYTRGEGEAEDIEHMDEIWEQCQAIIEGLAMVPLIKSP